jgi:tetratricopeptide (TPR) repeat protein
VLHAASSERQVCRGAAAQLAGAWDPGRRAAIAQSFAATGAPYAATAALGVAGSLDRYAAAWSAMRTEACEATRVRGEQSEELLDLRMACLDVRARELRALGDVLAHADAKVVEKSLQAVLALSPIDACADAAGLRATVRPPGAGERSRIDELRGALAEARALDSAGKFGDAIARAQRIVSDARALHYRPLEAVALTVLGIAQRDAGKLDDAQASLEAAVVAAIAGRDDASGGEAATVLVRLVGYDRAKRDEGEPWVARAEAFLEAHPDDRLRAQLENNLGVLRFGADRFDESLAHHRASLALRERVYGASNPLVAASLDNIGLAHDYKGDSATGTEFHRRALAIDIEALGPDHPTVALTLTNLAVSLRQQGKLEEALTTAQRALAIKEVAYGRDSTMVAVSLNEIGTNYYFQGRYAEAAEVFRRSLAIKQHTLGPDHPTVAGSLVNLANCLERLHQLDEADRLVHQALAIKLKALGPDHTDVGHSYTQLGQLALDRKQFAEARSDYERAAAIWRTAMSPDNPLIAAAEHGVGDAELGAGHVREAIAAYTRAAAIRDSKPVDLADRATTRFGLARALWAGGDRSRARQLASEAVEIFRSAGARADGDRREVEAWLTARR